MQRARGGGGGGAKADKDSWAKVLTDVIEATDGTGIKQMWQSGIQMTSHGGVRLFSLYQGLSSLDSELTITNTAIRTEVSRATAEEGRLSSSITQTAEQIALKVSKGDVSTQLAVECGNVTITGGNLVVDGYITSSDLQSYSGMIGALTTSSLHSNNDIEAEGDVKGYTLTTTDGEINVGNHTAEWQEQSVVTGLGTLRSFSIAGTVLRAFNETGATTTKTTIHYLGY